MDAAITSAHGHVLSTCPIARADSQCRGLLSRGGLCFAQSLEYGSTSYLGEEIHCYLKNPTPPGFK